MFNFWIKSELKRTNIERFERLPGSENTKCIKGYCDAFHQWLICYFLIYLIVFVFYKKVITNYCITVTLPVSIVSFTAYISVICTDFKICTEQWSTCFCMFSP